MKQSTVRVIGHYLGILWNLLTWLLGIPSSSPHALFGGLIGAAFAALGTAGVAWSSIAGKILIPAVVFPILAAVAAQSPADVVIGGDSIVLASTFPRGGTAWKGVPTRAETQQRLPRD